LFDLVKVVLADRKPLIREWYVVVEADTSLFFRFSDCAVDVCFASMLVSFREGPLFGLSATDQEDCIEIAYADCPIDLL